MNNKELLYKKLNALRLEVHSSIVDDIKSTVDAIFQEQNLRQTDCYTPCFVNVYGDANGRFLGDEDYQSYEAAYEGRGLSTYVETVEIVRKHDVYRRVNNHKG